jgi:hypothetical protein
MKLMLCEVSEVGYMLYGYEVRGMNILRDLKEAVRLDRSKDMSVRVSALTSYDWNALTPFVWALCC